MSRLNLKKSGLSTPTASVWGSRFIISAIIQAAIITLLTLLSVVVQLLFSSATNIIQYLSLSFDGASKWVFFGFIVYLILTVAIAVRAVFYNHLETYMRRKNRRI